MMEEEEEEEVCHDAFRWFGACPGRKAQREIEQRPYQAGGGGQGPAVSQT